MTLEPFEPEESDGTPPPPTALAATEQPIEIRVALVDDERTPEGMVCMGTFRGERLVARCVLPNEAWGEVQGRKLFAEPVPVVLVAREGPPGLQCQLFAVLPLSELELESSNDREPWADSVPGSGYEAAAAESEEEPDADPRMVAFPLGNIVRYAADRVHPDSLPLEAADVLRKVIEGKTSEVVDRALEDLFRNP